MLTQCVCMLSIRETAIYQKNPELNVLHVYK